MTGIVDKSTTNLDWLSGGGEMGALIRDFNWSRTSLGPIAGWPHSLRAIVRVVVTSRYAMWMSWGPELNVMYNDAYATMTLGKKHPWAVGRPASEVWAEIWPDIGPRIEHVLATGEATWDEGLRLFLERNEYREETYHTFSYSPLYDDDGNISGKLCVVTEDTERIIGERRLALLKELAARASDARDVYTAANLFSNALESDPYDLPFAGVYLCEPNSDRITLVSSTGTAVDHGLPHTIDIAMISGGKPSSNTQSGERTFVTDIPSDWGTPPDGVWKVPSRRAVVVTLSTGGNAGPSGVFIGGLNPFRQYDKDYEDFISLVASGLTASISNARSYEEARNRAETLAELDRAKTAFFSNVSHEFRTPLTLMLGPVDDVLKNESNLLGAPERELLAIVKRNGLRLLRLVNSLLDFSRIEAGRVKANYSPTDIALLTSDYVSVFRAATDKAGLKLHINCTPLSEPVFVDPEMWEKIVLNLVSNAFKFTLEGYIEVTLCEIDGYCVLRVKDSGTGIPEREVPRLFERFHRIEGAVGRTHEGSGIGLALVNELVRLHEGTITVESRVGVGSMFEVRIPLGSDHLPKDRIHYDPQVSGISGGAFLEEALKWLPGGADIVGNSDDWSEADPANYREYDGSVVVADDNADMRGYIARLLSERFKVTQARDGIEALVCIRNRRPDILLTDVMMPNLDGFGLLREIRSDPALETLPVVVLSARAGEEARVEGIESGADDYLVKPFSARELLATVTSQVSMSRLRRSQMSESEELNERLRRSMAETHHRVKNNLQVVAALVDIQTMIHTDKVPVDELVRIVQHIRSLAAIHDLLTQHAKTDGTAESVRASDVVEKLAPLLASVVGFRDIRFNISPVELALRQGTSLAVLINELVSNAIKHGDGSVLVELVEVGDKAVLRVSDQGPGFPDGFDPLVAANTGMELIESVGKHDLLGNISYSSLSEGGGCVEILFPVPMAGSNQ